MNPLNAETPLWAYLAGIAVVALACQAASWLKDRYELAGHRPVRRWYGTGAWVTLRAEEDDISAPRYTVVAWDAGNCEAPWLKVSQLAPDSRFWDEDSEPFWTPVTCFAPHSVRRFRPHLTRGRLPVLFARETFPGGSS